jgi:polyhydroxyalkanoate synthase subunit PhaC
MNRTALSSSDSATKIAALEGTKGNRGWFASGLSRATAAHPAVMLRGEMIDRLTHARQARVALSPAALMMAFYDWGLHLASSPGKPAALIQKAARKLARLATYLARALADPACPPCVEPLADAPGTSGRTEVTSC